MIALITVAGRFHDVFMSVSDRFHGIPSCVSVQGKTEIGRVGVDGKIWRRGQGAQGACVPLPDQHLSLRGQIGSSSASGFGLQRGMG